MSRSKTSPAEDAVSIDHARRVRKEQYPITAIVSLGGCLEFYDFAIFIFFADVIGELFFPVGMPGWLRTFQTWGLFAAGYLFRPLGGVVLAHFGDLFGRKRVFAFSILLMATSTLVIGLLPTYASVGAIAPVLLLLCRVLQGIAIGGEVPGAWTFVSEHAPQKNVGWACGMVCGGLALGILVASSVAAIVNSLLQINDLHLFGWRLPFLLGGAFGLAGIKLRRILNETPVFTSLRKDKMLVPELPLRAVLRTQSYAVLWSMLVTWILSSVVVLTLMMPMMLHNIYGFEKEQALLAASVSTLFLAIGAVIAGALLDWIGPARFFLLFVIFLLIGALAYLRMSDTDTMELYLLCAVVGLSGGVTAGAPYVMVSSFPARVRYTGVSFAYNTSYAFFGGVTPLLITAMAPLGVTGYVIYYVLISISSAVLGITLMRRPKLFGGMRGDPDRVH